ncbi:hypothetical protein BN11_4830003 [Nostocoides australiense Ben110]|uniref:Uncharacterized protein n=1 Tax=Nostocoides australiense Ben110 TaxID=1193182 RepID=W6JZ17_9MICO|nr:hypothetical protein [Tetrasphaera australiensis]CCH74828.1 hypothetical protein BN11_4830003 [Tetrasphaera australiensis Ben110]
MSTADLLGNAEQHSNTSHASTTPAPDAAESTSLTRMAGWAGIAVFALWLCQPILVGLLASSGADDAPDLAALDD